MPFPLIKLAYLAVKHLSKPLANRIKLKAKTTPFLRNSVLLPAAQLYHKFDITITMRNIGLGKSVDVKPLDEDLAVDLAAEMLGELFIFSIGVGILWLEYRRQQRKDVIKEDDQNRRLHELEMNIHELGMSIDTNSAMIREINRALAAADFKTSGSQLPKKITDPSSKTVLKVSNATPSKT